MLLDDILGGINSVVDNVSGAVGGVYETINNIELSKIDFEKEAQGYNNIVQDNKPQNKSGSNQDARSSFFGVDGEIDNKTLLIGGGVIAFGVALIIIKSK